MAVYFFTGVSTVIDSMYVFAYLYIGSDLSNNAEEIKYTIVLIIEILFHHINP